MPKRVKCYALQGRTQPTHHHRGKDTVIQAKNWLNTTMIMFLGLDAKQFESSWDRKVALRCEAQE